MTYIIKIIAGIQFFIPPVLQRNVKFLNYTVYDFSLNETTVSLNEV